MCEFIEISVWKFYMWVRRFEVQVWDAIYMCDFIEISV